MAKYTSPAVRMRLQRQKPQQTRISLCRDAQEAIPIIAEANAGATAAQATFSAATTVTAIAARLTRSTIGTASVISVRAIIQTSAAAAATSVQVQATFSHVPITIPIAAQAATRTIAAGLAAAGRTKTNATKPCTAMAIGAPAVVLTSLIA